MFQNFFNRSQLRRFTRMGAIIFHTALTAAAVLALSCGVAHAQYITIDDPLATSTNAEGVSGNNVVGYYSNSSGTYGFEFNGLSYTTIIYPAHTITRTRVYGISVNTMVGSWIGESAYSNGFVYDGTTFTTLDDPLGTEGTTATGISGNNIVGYYYTGSVYHGFVYNGSSYTTLDDPLANGSTEALGIDGNNIVGTYLVGGNEYGFLYNGTTYTTIGPSLSSITDSQGISGASIVGTYLVLGGTHGYAYNGSSYASFDIPLADYTELHGIDGGNVVGSFGIGGGNSQGFEASLVPAASTPEPGSIAMLVGLGIAGACALLRRRAMRF